MAKWHPQMVRLHLVASAPSIDGILVRKPGEFYCVAKPELVSEEKTNLAMDGEVWVPKDRVLFCQVLGSSGG